MLDVLLQQYKILLRALDEKCEETLKAIPEIPCRKGCYDCCKQLFPLSMIEAFYINEGFLTLPRATRRELERKAEKLMAGLEKLNLKQYEVSSDSLEDIASARNSLTQALQSTKIDCPLLTEDGTCMLYEYRNHDCRIHGVSYDQSAEKIVGCSRYKKLGSILEKHNQLVDSSFLYKEKSKLDSMLTMELSGNPALNRCYYFTTPFTPLLKNYRETDWQTFFPTDAPPDAKYSLIIDL